ncbi:MAG: hypothetical protein KDD69_03795 [Bdellovibrionales bacterium]|nr:hypothetical protein [Bdellovibrionales bacterium]
MKATLPLLFFACLLGMGQSGVELLGHRLSSSAETSAQTISAERPLYDRSSLRSDFEVLIRKWERATHFSPWDSEVTQSLARARLASLPTLPLAERPNAVCASLRDLRSAVQRSPQEAALHVAIADIEALAPSWRTLCEIDAAEPFTSTSERLRWVQVLAPFSVTEQYLSAVVYLALGEKEDALDLLRKNQEINPYFSQAQREFTYRLIENEGQLQTALPKKYPEITYWIKHYARQQPAALERYGAVFLGALREAVTDLVARYRSGQLPVRPFGQYLKNIRHLPLVEADPGLIATLDQMLIDVYRAEGNAWWADVLRRQTSSTRIPILKTMLADDHAPGSRMLYGWTTDLETRSAALDEPSQSAGIFLPDGYLPDFLVLQTSESDGRLDPSELDLLGSRDNERFHPFLPRSTPSVGSVDGKATLLLELPPTDFRYFKIHYRGNAKRARFSAPLAELFELYGRPTR